MITHKVRVVQIEGEPWFLINDVAECLGWTRDNAKYHRKVSLRPDEKGVVALPRNQRGSPDVAVVSESGLYKLVMRSDKPQSKHFQDWLTREVLSTIRKTGHLQAPQRRLYPAPYGHCWGQACTLRACGVMVSSLSC